MSLFSVAQAAPLEGPAVRTRPAASSGSGNTPITGSSSGGSGASNGSSTGSSTGSSNGGGSTIGSNGSNNGGASIPGNNSNSGSVGGNNGSLNNGASPITSGNRPGTEGGNNAPRPGPRSPNDQPNAGGTGPFGEAPTPRTMDGTEGKGFNFGNILSGFNSLTSTLFQLVATFAMLKDIFGFGKGDRAKRGSDGVKEVAAVADRGVNVARDASTKIDETLEEERARAEGEGASDIGPDGDPEDAESAGWSSRN